jgi:ATP-dependent Clp protease, protease subunit
MSNNEHTTGQDLHSAHTKTYGLNPPDQTWIPEGEEAQEIQKRRCQQLLEGQYTGISKYLSPQLLKNRIIYIDTPIEDEVANSIISQLLYLQSEDTTRDIHLYLNSPGGNIYAGLAIYDTIHALLPAVATYCLGRANGFATLLLAAGKKGKRYALPTSTIGLTQVLGGGETPADIEITAREILRLRHILVDLFVKETGQAEATIREDMDRGIALSAREAISYGFLDRVIDALDEEF